MATMVGCCREYKQLTRIKSMGIKMRYFTDTELLQIIKDDESDRIEFKESVSGQDERILNEKRRYLERPFDLYPIPTTGISDLNLALFSYEYLPKAFSEEILDANDRNLNEQLAATKMITTADDPIATVLGILSIGKTPQDFLPGAYVQFLRIDGNELTDDIIDSLTIQGSILDQV